MIPAVAELNGWKRLRRLREYLQRQDRLLEARAILDQELGHTPDGSEQEKACRSLLEACSNQESSKHPIWWIAGRSKLRLGQILTTGSQLQASNDEFQGARCALQAARASGHENNCLLLVRLAELNALSKFERKNVLHAYEEFVRSPSVKKDNYVNSTALSRACKHALSHLESDKSLSNFKTFWQWNAKAESISKELGDIAYLLIFRLATGDIACSLEDDFGAILKWHENFEMQYRSFHLWRQKIAVRKTNLVIYNRLRDKDNIRRTLDEMGAIAADQDDFWSYDGYRKQVDTQASAKNRKPDKLSTPAAFQNGDPEMDWLLEWSKEMPVGMNAGWEERKFQIVPNSRVASSLLEVNLCSWIKEEFQAGVLAKENLRDILSLDSADDADLLQMIEIIEDCHIKQDGTEEYSEGKVRLAASNLENGTNSIFEDQTLSLTPKFVSCRLFGTRKAPTNEVRWEKAFSTLSDWLLRKSNRSAARRHILLLTIQSQRLSYVIDSATPYELRAVEAQRLIDLFPKLDAKVQHHFSSNLAYWRSTVAAAKHMMYIKSNNHVLLDMHSTELKEIIEHYNQSLSDNRESNGPLIQEVYINMDMARVYFHAAAKLDPIAREGLFNAAARAVQAFEKIRAGWRALIGWDRVHKLLLALENRRILQIAPTVVAVLCHIPDDKREMRDKMIWDMIQFAKSIGISWLMESNAADAQERATEGKNDTYMEADGSQGEPKMAGDSMGNFSIQPNISQNNDEALTSGDRQVIAKEDSIKAGSLSKDQPNASLNTDQLQADLQNINRLGGDAVFVDWYNSACGLAEPPRPVITTLTRTNEGPRCYLAKITWKEVDELVNDFMELETEDLKDSEFTEFLYELNPLVEPLAWTKPGQTLVFSPCGNLHRIPLHALKIDGEVIIKRNPVVYCSSLSALVSANRLRIQVEEPRSSTPTTAHHLDAEEIESSTDTVSYQGISLFGNPPTPIGKAALKATATKFKARALTDIDFTASFFTSTIQDPNLHLLHFHGHADFSPTAHTDHCLLFSDKPLTLRDIFDLPSPLSHGGGFHVTLLGCGSGMSKTGPTDDVIGLVPSLLYAGASSTVSTLWKFSDADASTYSESFYEGFFRGSAEAGGGNASEDTNSAGGAVVDMARANQKAVLGIMQRKPALYHWGSFVLNGYWMMRSPFNRVRNVEP